MRRERLGFLHELAARRAHQGVSLEAFIRAYRIALLTIWDACTVDAARLGISREAGFALARSAIDAIDILTTQAAEAHLREETRIRTESGRASRDLLDRLIDGRLTDTRRRHPAAPGLDPTGRLLTIVGSVEQTSLAVGEAPACVGHARGDHVARDCATTRRDPPRGLVLITSSGVLPGTRVASLHAARQRTIDQHNVDVHYGVSVPAQGFADVQQAYREAAMSLSYSSPTRPIVSLDDLSALECAVIGATAPTKALIASKGDRLRSLSDDDRAAAVATIRAFAAADLNVTRAAEQMHVHPNTVRYRLQQITSRTGHDPRTFAGLVDLICILEVTADEHQP